MRRRLFRPVALVTVVSLTTFGLVTALNAAPADATLITQSKTLYFVKDSPVPRLTYDRYGNSLRMPTCETFPGVTMDGNILAKAYIGSTSYIKLYFTYLTHYDENVAIAKNARPDFTCLQLAQFGRYSASYGGTLGSIKALNDSACATANATVANSWCRLVSWELDPKIGGVKDAKHTVYDSLDLGLNGLCRQPGYVRDPNTDQPYNPPHKTADGLPVYRGPASYEGWTDPGVTLQTENLDGSIDSGLLSAVNTAKNVFAVVGLVVKIGELLAGAISWSQFLQDVLSGVNGLSVSNPYLAVIAMVIETLVLIIFSAVIDGSADVKVGSFTMAGGAAPIDPGATRPDGSGQYGAYVGYGKVQNLTASNDYADWLSQQAAALYQSAPGTYPNPSASPANAIAMQKIIAGKIAKANDPLHDASIQKRGTYCVNKDSAGNVLPGQKVPWMSKVMESWNGEGATVSQIALDTMLRQWIHSMVPGFPTDHNFICTAAQGAALAAATRRSVVHAGADDPNNPLNDPWLKASLECHVGTIGQLITATWIPGGTDVQRDKPNFCMNRYPSITKHDGTWHFYVPDVWATLTDKDFHCGENEHFSQFFTLIEGFL